MANCISLKRLFEDSYPWIAAIIAIAIFYYFKVTFDSNRISNQLSSSINISAILMGFLGTAKAMLLSLSTNRFKWLKSKDHIWSAVLRFFRLALLSNFLLCLYSLTLFSIDESKLPAMVTRLIMPLWIGLVTLSIFSFYRVLKIIFALLKSDN